LIIFSKVNNIYNKIPKMKDNFDLKKYLKDNEVMEKSNKYVAATLKEDKKVEEKKPLKEGKDALREKIKNMVMAEMADMEDHMKEEIDEASCGYEEDGMGEAMSKKKKSLDDGIKTADSYMNEAEDEIESDESEDIETEEEVDVVDTEDIPEEEDVVTDKGGIMSNLEAAMEKARELGDEKLIDQLGNTITFYTRQHISK
tara:strand:- start:261 stop:860 length:600 start_codon:yes stop_codon:yes gene_type:complete